MTVRFLMLRRSFSTLFLLVLFAACQPKDPKASSCGDSKLEFGTAIGGNGFELLGTGDEFSKALTGGGTIAFRLTSNDDIGTRTLRLYTYYANSAGAGTSDLGAPYWQNDFPPAQDYGCMMLSSFRITDAGSYDVHAFLVAGEGNEVAVASAPIQITE